MFSGFVKVQNVREFIQTALKQFPLCPRRCPGRPNREQQRNSGWRIVKPRSWERNDHWRWYMRISMEVQVKFPVAIPVQLIHKSMRRRMLFYFHSSSISHTGISRAKVFCSLFLSSLILLQHWDNSNWRDKNGREERGVEDGRVQAQGREREKTAPLIPLARAWPHAGIARVHRKVFIWLFVCFPEAVIYWIKAAFET